MTDPTTTEAPERIYWTPINFHPVLDADVDGAGFAWRTPDTDRVEYVRADLSRPAPVTVKPLVWEGDGLWSAGDNEGWMEEANTAFGWGYSIEFGRSGNFLADSTFDWSSDGHEAPDEAKAAAQADYERRILSALTQPEITGTPSNLDKTGAQDVAQAARVLLDAFTGEESEADFKPAWESWRKETWGRDGSIYAAMSAFLRALAKEQG